MLLQELGRFTKDQLDLVPVEFMEAVIAVFENGAAKYGRHSWEEGKHYEDSKNLDSVFHHLCDCRSGIKEDKDSGIHPAAHAATRLLMRYTLDRRNAGLPSSRKLGLWKNKLTISSDFDDPIDLGGS